MAAMLVYPLWGDTLCLRSPRVGQIITGQMLIDMPAMLKNVITEKGQGIHALAFMVLGKNFTGWVSEGSAWGA